MATTYPKTSTAFRRMVFNLRGLLSSILLELAIKAAPEEEKDSLIIAVGTHYERICEL